jgi:hypothetical protein
MSAIGAFKDINVEEMGSDPEAAMNYFNKVIADWIENNPDKADEIANETVAAIREYEMLQGN